jgi:hypothetical protein
MACIPSPFPIFFISRCFALKRHSHRVAVPGHVQPQKATMPFFPVLEIGMTTRRYTVESLKEFATAL